MGYSFQMERFFSWHDLLSVQISAKDVKDISAKVG